MTLHLARDGGIWWMHPLHCSLETIFKLSLLSILDWPVGWFKHLWSFETDIFRWGQVLLSKVKVFKANNSFLSGRLLHIDLWQSRQSGISLHWYMLLKQAEAAHVGWQPEECRHYEIIYTWVPMADTVSLGYIVGQSRGPEITSKCL